MTLVPDRIITKPDGTKVRTLDRNYLLDGEKLIPLPELLSMIEVTFDKVPSFMDLILERLRTEEKQSGDKELISYIIVKGGHYSLAGQDQCCRLLWQAAVHLLVMNQVNHVVEIPKQE
ncbi:hypothetical protein KFE96_04975 [Kordiimonas sp. SCSIO 12603]|uniref:hypothetical protein n=1 Tax=Kordiimonas sp. SCSIO 12603 TaxID=2829596 RepID=UPI002103ADFB|nr:hypothetical protein [Kordiimonas sp. SCSIO 12603]UTW59659.1 hypothetical protein KFE96_04975 [Kordiimonas sp. SCSIO 12603]